MNLERGTSTMEFRKLKALRMMNALQQEDMAKLLEISLRAYNFKENGRNFFTIAEIEKIMEYFNLPYEEIFTRDIRKGGE